MLQVVIAVADSVAVCKVGMVMLLAVAWCCIEMHIGWECAIWNGRIMNIVYGVDVNWKVRKLENLAMAQFVIENYELRGVGNCSLAQNIQNNSANFYGKVISVRTVTYVAVFFRII